MKAEYTEWIEQWLSQFEHPAFCLGLCFAAVNEMLDAFPELRKVRGHAVCPESWGVRAHWWLETEDGEVVDPTFVQFTVGVFTYQEWSEGEELRLGKCMNCGEEIWGTEPSAVYRTDLCSEACGDAFVASLNGGMNYGC